jgi:IS5 family transposase
MADQVTFAELAWNSKRKVTRRERFLKEMDAVIPWQRILPLIEPFYAKPGPGRPPLGLEKMLRIYFVQHWYDLSDPGAEEAIYESESIRRFVGVELAEDTVPDESSILRFRHLLEEHDLTRAIFDEVGALLEEKGLLMKQGTIVDATFLAAPSSTKNSTRTRDPEMRSTKKGNMWHFGMKAHVGTDTRGIVHSLTTTDAAQSDFAQLPDLIHGEEEELYGDRAYWSEDDRASFESAEVRYKVNRRGTAKNPVTEEWKEINRERSRVRSMCEHPFLVVKRLWGFRKVRYRGLAKNTVRLFSAFALANLYRLRRELLAAGA